jgi:hypothetical protein
LRKLSVIVTGALRRLKTGFASEGAGHVAGEDDVAGGDALELAGEAIAVGEDQVVRRPGCGWPGWSGRGLSMDKQGEGEAGERQREVRRTVISLMRRIG